MKKSFKKTASNHIPETIREAGLLYIHRLCRRGRLSGRLSRSCSRQERRRLQVGGCHRVVNGLGVILDRRLHVDRSRCHCLRAGNEVGHGCSISLSLKHRHQIRDGCGLGFQHCQRLQEVCEIGYTRREKTECKSHVVDDLRADIHTGVGSGLHNSFRVGNEVSRGGRVYKGRASDFIGGIQGNSHQWWSPDRL